MNLESSIMKHNCGGIISNKDTFCPHCGYKINFKSSDLDEDDLEDSFVSKLFSWTIFVLFIVGIIFSYKYIVEDRINLKSSFENLTKPLQRLTNSFQQGSDLLKISYRKYGNEFGYYGEYILTSKTDLIEIYKVIPNRGNCDDGKSIKIEQNVHKKLKFADTTIYSSSCAPLEVEVDTDKGNFTFKFK